MSNKVLLKVDFKPVVYLCDAIVDGVAHCGVVNRTDICSLLEVLCTD